MSFMLPLWHFAGEEIIANALAEAQELQMDDHDDEAMGKSDEVEELKKI